jgi:hypothetical protein
MGSVRAEREACYSEDVIPEKRRLEIGFGGRRRIGVGLEDVEVVDEVEREGVRVGIYLCIRISMSTVGLGLGLGLGSGSGSGLGLGLGGDGRGERRGR